MNSAQLCSVPEGQDQLTQKGWSSSGVFLYKEQRESSMHLPRQGQHGLGKLLLTCSSTQFPSGDTNLPAFLRSTGAGSKVQGSLFHVTLKDLHQED